MKFQPNILSSWKGYNQQLFINDVFAGLSVGVIALPLSMAFAIASGLKPEVGIFTAIIAGALVATLGGCRVQIGGPAGAFIVIVYGILHTYGPVNLLIATALSGVLLFLMGLFRVGGLIRLIPQTVIHGFTSGIAILIFLSQLKEFLGLSVEVPADFFSMLEAIYSHLHEYNPITLKTALLCLAFLFAWRMSKKYFRVCNHIPEILLVMILATWGVHVFHLPIETIGTRFGGIPNHWPALVIPSFASVDLAHLFVPIVTLAILGAIESLLCARVADGLTHQSHNSNQELMGQGLTNFFLPFIGGMPATGTIARTVTNIKSGGTSPISGLVHSLTLVLIVFFFGHLATEIPLACLSAILIYVAWNMGDWVHLRQIRQRPFSDQVSLVMVFILTVVCNLALAIGFGLCWALFNYWFKQHKTRL